MKRLIALISTKEKTRDQSTREVMAAVQKYLKIKAQVETDLALQKKRK